MRSGSSCHQTCRHLSLRRLQTKSQAAWWAERGFLETPQAICVCAADRLHAIQDPRGSTGANRKQSYRFLETLALVFCDQLSHARLSLRKPKIQILFVRIKFALMSVGSNLFPKCWCVDVAMNRVPTEPNQSGNRS